MAKAFARVPIPRDIVKQVRDSIPESECPTIGEAVTLYLQQQLNPRGKTDGKEERTK